jgi:UDP-N-acetylglucosamine transferase subunit ALG13
MTSSELVIVHAGAGSIIQAMQAGKVPVVMPRRASLGEHVDDHQLELVRELAQRGKVVLATDCKSLKQGVARALELQRSGVAHASSPPLVSLLRDRLAGYARHLERARDRG